VTDRTPGIELIAGTQASEMRSVSTSDAPGGREIITLNESSRNGGRKLEPNPIATYIAYAAAVKASKTMIFGKRNATFRKGR
jgi:hypothetical protein